jgi:hypothetical protein
MPVWLIVWLFVLLEFNCGTKMTSSHQLHSFKTRIYIHGLFPFHSLSSRWIYTSYTYTCTATLLVYKRINTYIYIHMRCYLQIEMMHIHIYIHGCIFWEYICVHPNWASPARQRHGQAQQRCPPACTGCSTAPPLRCHSGLLVKIILQSNRVWDQVYSYRYVAVWNSG